MLGTIGWIVAGVVVGKLLHADALAIADARRRHAPRSSSAGFAHAAAPHAAESGRHALLGARRPGSRRACATQGSLIPDFRASGHFCSASRCSSTTRFANPFLNEIGVKDAAFIQTFGQMSRTGLHARAAAAAAPARDQVDHARGDGAWALRYLAFGYGNAGTACG